MKRYLTIVGITCGETIRRIEVLIVLMLGLLFVTGISFVMIDEDLATQVSKGVADIQGSAVDTELLIDAALVYSEIFVLIAGFLIGMGFTQRDIKTGAVAQYLTKPVRREVYILAKFTGSVLVAYSFFLLYTALVYGMLLIRGEADLLPMSRLLFLSLFKLTLFFSLVTLFNQKMHGFVAALLALGVYVGSYFIDNLYVMSIGATARIKFPALFAYYVMPHLSIVSSSSLIDAATRLKDLIKWFFIYGIFYSSALVAAGVMLFRRRALS